MTTVFSPHVLHQHREELCEWAKANGLTPADIPLDRPLRVEEGEAGPVIRYHAYVRADGLLPNGITIRSGEALTEERTAPCLTPPPHLGHPDPHPTPAGT